MTDPRPPAWRRHPGALALIGLTLVVGLIAVGVAVVALDAPGTTLVSRGPAAEPALFLHWVMFGMGGGVMLLILGVLLWAVVRGGGAEERRQGGLMLVVSGGIILPLVLLPVIWTMTIGAMVDLSEPTAEPAITVEVSASQWSYDVACLESGEVTRNELSIPVGEPVRVRVTSNDVIHSFWAPQLAGKQDMNPGRWHEIWIEADEPGTYLVQCSEYCGIGHATHTMLISAGDAGSCGAGAAGAGGCCG